MRLQTPKEPIAIAKYSVRIFFTAENSYKCFISINKKVGVEFYQRLFRIIGIQKDACIGIAKKFYNCSFDPDEKNFKNISMFDFGTKFGVPLAYRKGFKCFDHGIATLTKQDVALPLIGIRRIL